MASIVFFVTSANAQEKSLDEKNTSLNEINKSLQETGRYSISAVSKEKLLKEMIWVDGGTFEMGSNAKAANEMERPVHTVSLDGFYIGQSEVTQILFFELMGWNYSYFACENCPVNNISWMNMHLFIERLNLATGKSFRFPTEAEWAYAAKGGQKSRGYLYSGSNNIDDVAWFSENAERRSHPVAEKKPNELGLYDMTGNLWEFCQDDMSRVAYSHTSKHNPLYSLGVDAKKVTMKVLRGSGYEFEANESQVFKRDGASSNVRMPDIGFRLAMSKK